jgi:adenylate cyclase
LSDGPLLDLFRADVAACGARIEENLTALIAADAGDVADVGDAGAWPSPPARLAAIARDSRTICGGARILGIQPAIRLAQAIEDTAGAGARAQVVVGSAAAEALLAATTLLGHVAAAGAALAAWLAHHAVEVDGAVSAIASSIGEHLAAGKAEGRAQETTRPPAPVRWTLPLPPTNSGGDSADPAGPTTDPPRGTLRGMTVLLVDDQPMIAEAIRQMLATEPGIRLHHCIDPTQALAMAAEVQPTVILQDLIMPDVDGLTLVRYFRAHAATVDVPIIVLSTREEPATKAEAFQFGANDYVVKLPDRLELVARIRYHSTGFLHLLDSREAWAAALASHEQLEIRNRFIRQVFGRYLSDEIVESLLEKPGGLELGGETRRVTIMMTDLRGFMPMCETLEPRQVVTILNNYLGAMTEVIVRHGGTINEFIGDAILAVFGAPIRRDDDARRAIACAVEMQATMDGVNARNSAAGLPRVEMGIGLNTGEVVVGNVGSDRRAKYGVVGRHVNLASRIESHTIGGQILAAASTIGDAGEGIRIDGQMEIVPKGVTRPMKLYEVGGIGPPYDRYLAISKSEPLVPLKSPIPVRFVVLQGGSGDGPMHAGDLVSLSSRMGRVRADHSVAPMENVKIELWDQNLRAAELWGKTIVRIASAQPNLCTFDVWFTSMPDEIREVFDALRASSAV